MFAAHSPVHAGFSLVEALTVTAILGLLCALASPGLADMVQRQRVLSVGESFRSDFQQARMLAIGSGRSVRIAFVEHGAGSCYVVYQGDLGSCRCEADGKASCAQAQQLVQHQWLAKTRGLRIQANVAAMSIDGAAGTVTPTATVRVRGSLGRELAQVVALTGRVRSCGDADTHLPPCQV